MKMIQKCTIQKENIKKYTGRYKNKPLLSEDYDDEKKCMSNFISNEKKY